MYGGGGGRRRCGRSSKPKKKKKENWFGESSMIWISPLSLSPTFTLSRFTARRDSSERLTVDQNKQLCKAAKLRHVGNKKELIARLLEEEQTSKYALEAHRVGLNVERIKAMCRERGLQVGGSKFDLVLRVLHCDNGTTPAGETLKRAAATTDADPSGAPKRRKKAAPSASRVYARVQKKIEAVTQKKYQSHWGSKTHSTDVYDLVASILSEVVNSEERYLETKPRFAMTLAEAACTSLTDNFDTMCRKGYDDGGGWEIIDSRLRQIADAARPVLLGGQA